MTGWCVEWEVPDGFRAEMTARLIYVGSALMENMGPRGGFFTAPGGLSESMRTW